MTRMRVVAVMPGLFPSTIIGIIKPLLKLSKQKQIKFKVLLSRTCRKSQLKNADVVIFCRNTEPHDLKLLYWSKELNKKIIYEIDDNFFEISLNTPLGKYHRDPSRIYVLRRFIELADIVHVYSNPMFEIANKYSSSVLLINSYFDFDLIQNIVQKKHIKNKLKIAYATSRGSNDELRNTFEKAIVEILKKYNEKVELYLWGDIPSNLKLYKNVKKFPFQRDYNQFIKSFYEFGFDIGLAPLKNDLFHRSKTNNKFREYGACLVAGIYSNVDVYSDCIENGVTGLIVENTQEEWFNAMELLITNHSLREDIKKNAHVKVRNDYSFENCINQWKKTLLRVTESESSRNKILNHYNLLIIKVIVEKKNDVLLKKRLNSLYEAGMRFSMKLSSIFDDDLNNKDIISNDLIVIAAKDIEGAIHIVEKIGSIEIPIIVDIHDKCSTTDLLRLKQYSVDFVTSPGNHNENKIIHISDYSEFIDVDQNLDITIDRLYYHSLGRPLSYDLLKGSSANEIFENFRLIPGNIESNKDNYYSEHSSVINWLDLLAKYKGSYKSKIIKTPIFVERIIKKVIGKVSFIGKRYRYLRNVYSTFKILFKINVLKKYD